MASHEITNLNLDIPLDWRVLLLMHDRMQGFTIGDEVYDVSDKGIAVVNAIKGLYLHKDLDRFAMEMIQIGATYGSA